MDLPAKVHNQITGVVNGAVIQAATVTLAGPGPEILDQLHRAHRQLTTSQRAERRTAMLVSILYLALARAFRLVGELAREDDRKRLAEAERTYGRTQRQIGRAETEQQRAARLVATIGRKVVTLQQRLLQLAPAQAANFQIEAMDAAGFSSEEVLDDLNAGLDRIDQLLDAQDEELAQLDFEVAEWMEQAVPPAITAPDEGPSATTRAADEHTYADQLRKIISDETISLNHRLEAASKIVYRHKNHTAGIDRYLRLMIMHESTSHPDKLHIIVMLAELGPRHRVEAVAMLRQMVDSSSPDLLKRVHAAARLADLSGADKDYAVTFLRKAAENSIQNSDPFKRITAARAWWKICPEDSETIATIVREVANDDEITESEKKYVAELVHDILTDPRVNFPNSRVR